MKVFVLGIDGATFDLINPWVDAGKLPNVKALMEHGSYGTLNSTIPAHSAPSWSSCITGKNPGKHGIFDFSEHVPGAYSVRLVNASNREGPSIWSIISQYGKKVGVINVPMTYPPEKVNGFLISGMDAPGVSSNFTYPEALSNELKSVVNDYELEAGLWSYISKGQIDTAIHKQFETLDKRFELTKYLMKRYPWDFFVIVFTATDRAQHAFWRFMDPGHPLYRPEDAEKYGNPILEIYRKLDDFVGYLSQALDDDTALLVVSDHGAGASSNKTIYLNNWLCQKGLLAYKDSCAQDGNGVGCLERATKTLYDRFVSGTLRDFWRTMARGKRDKIKKWFPKLFNRMASQFFFSRIDMERTKAYAEESKHFIWLNVKGRDLKGIIDAGDEYHEIRDFIVHELTTETDPESNQPLVEGVFKKEDIYFGKYLDKAPDLVVTFRDGGHVPRPSYTVDPEVAVRTIPRDELERLEGKTRENGRHLPNGIVLMKGRNINRQKIIENAHMVDVAPTILYLLGLRVPRDMDGKVLECALDRDFLTTHPVMYDNGDTYSDDETQLFGYSPEEEEAIKQRLGDLGYLE